MSKQTSNTPRTTRGSQAAANQLRGERTTAETRTDRALEDRRVTEERVLSDDERVEMFRQQFVQAALPDLPKIDGYHVCWLTTSNPRDSIHTRIRLGYELVRESDIPGWNYVSLKTGEYAGCIGVNEMVAAKLPLHLYHQYMKAVHHDAPLAEEEKLRANMEFLKEQAKRYGGKLHVGDGDQELGEDERMAVFTE